MNQDVDLQEGRRTPASILSGSHGIAVDAALFLSAFALRFALGFRTDLWFDEIHSIAIAENSFSEIVSPAVLNGFGPLYFILLKTWMSFSTQDIWLRLPTILASSIMPVLLRRYLARQFESGTAILAAAFCVMAPWNIYIGSQVRMHVFGGIILLSWLLSHSTRTRAIGALLGSLTLPTLAPFFLVLWFAPGCRKNRPGLALALGATILIVAAGISSGVHYDAAQLRQIPGTIKAIFFGPYLESPPSFFSIAISGIAMFLTLRGTWSAGRKGLLLTALAYIPLHLILALSLVATSFWNRRFVIPSAPFIFALTAIGIMSLPKRMKTIVAIASLLVTSHFTYRLMDLTDNFHWRKDRRPLMQELVAELRALDRPILLDLPAIAPVVMWYGPDLKACGDSRTVTFALPSHRPIIESFLRRRGVQWEGVPEEMNPFPLSDHPHTRR